MAVAVPPPTPPLAAPAGVRLTARARDALVVWRAVYGARRYLVERRAPGAPRWDLVGITGDHAWADGRAAPTVAYSYRVLALDGRRLSAPSAPVAEPALNAEQLAWASGAGFSEATVLGLRAALAGGPGTPFGLGGLDLRALPRLPHQEWARAGPVLLLGDNPEVARQDGVLYRTVVSGRERLLFDVVNATGDRAEAALVLYNAGPRPVPYDVTGLHAGAGGVLSAGEAVAAGLLGGFANRMRGTLAPGAAVAFGGGAGPLAPGAFLLGDDELDAGGLLQAGLVLLPVGRDPAAAFRGGALPWESPDPRGGSGRGTFADSARRLALRPPAGRPAGMLLGDGSDLPYARGFDALQGLPAQDYGNYGVVYRIGGTVRGPVALVAVPLGGEYFGAVAAGGHVAAAPSRPLPADGTTGFLIGVWAPGRPDALRWTPPPGSALPLEVVSIPLAVAAVAPVAAG